MFTTQLTVFISTRSHLILILTVTLDTLIKRLAVNGAFPFGKHCDFLERIACLRTGTSFLVLPLFL